VRHQAHTLVELDGFFDPAAREIVRIAEAMTKPDGTERYRIIRFHEACHYGHWIGLERIVGPATREALRQQLKAGREHRAELQKQEDDRKRARYAQFRAKYPNHISM
jgi:peptidoglycan hydrolase-like protein with peptidoglycan-binding domain